MGNHLIQSEQTSQTRPRASALHKLEDRFGRDLIESIHHNDDAHSLFTHDLRTASLFTQIHCLHTDSLSTHSLTQIHCSHRFTVNTQLKDSFGQTCCEHIIHNFEDSQRKDR